MTTSLSAMLWDAIDDVYTAILAHPFLTGLTDGSLDDDAFRFYVVQDALYLGEYARALALCSARAPSSDAVAMFAQHAAGAIEVEQELHRGFLSDFGMTQSDVEATRLAPTCRAYTSYLLAVCHGASFPQALGAVLPCYWIYREVGASLLEHGSPDPRYQRWIDTYGGDEFAAIVDQVLALTDRVGGTIPDDERARVRDHFVTTSRYEYMFWDMGYRQERWPV